MISIRVGFNASCDVGGCESTLIYEDEPNWYPAYHELDFAADEWIDVTYDGKRYQLCPDHADSDPAILTHHGTDDSLPGLARAWWRGLGNTDTEKREGS